MAFPRILTAIPQQRYRYGDFGVTILGDVESGDDRAYRYVAAFVREGENQPQLFVVAETLPPGRREQGSHALRVINTAMDEVLDVDERWARMSDFVAQALQTGAQMLGLEQEQPYQVQ